MLSDGWWLGGTSWTWERRRVWYPCRSSVSGQQLFGDRAWYGFRHVLGPAGEGHVLLEQWLTDEEYTWYRLSAN